MLDVGFFGRGVTGSIAREEVVRITENSDSLSG